MSNTSSVLLNYLREVQDPFFLVWEIYVFSIVSTKCVQAYHNKLLLKKINVKYFTIIKPSSSLWN